jgi:hypothetical protein
MFLLAAVAVSGLLLMGLRTGAASSQPVKPFQASFGDMRIENEDKLVVPTDKVEEVWQYMVDRFVNDKSFLKSMNLDFDSYWYDELFTDRYFDTPDLVMHAHESGIRHRKRVNITDPNNRKHGRELVQIKLNDIDSNVMNRGEVKFDVEHLTNIKEADDAHPLLGIIKRSEREEFKKAMAQLGIDPYSLKEILVNQQRRRSLYITRDGGQFISIRLDQCSSDLALAQWRHVELEPELNEIPYTEGDAAQRAYMEDVNAKIIEDLQRRFPEIKRDLTPKYNKAFNYFESRIPCLRFLIKNNLI